MEKEPRIAARKMYKPEEIVNLLRLVLLPTRHTLAVSACLFLTDTNQASPLT